MIGTKFSTIKRTCPQIPALVEYRVEQTANPSPLFIHKSKKFTIMNGSTEFWWDRDCPDFFLVGGWIRICARREKKFRPLFEEGCEGFSRMIFEVIEAAARTTGLGMVRLTEVKRILGHTGTK